MVYFRMQNFSRVKRGCQWPAFWKSDGFRNRAAFRREYTLASPTVFTVYGVTGSQGYVQVRQEKHPLGWEISCPQGHHRISVHIACIGCMPSIYVAGDVMLKFGAVTFWEEFDPGKSAGEQYEMYGDPYGKSLCHAWAASPIYLLARYFVGFRPTSTGGKTYAVELKNQYFTHLDCTFPMGEKLVHIRWENGKLEIEGEGPA